GRVGMRRGVTVQQVDLVAHAAHFGFEVEGAFGVRGGDQGHARGDGDAELAERVDFGRVVGQEPDGADVEVAEDVGGDLVSALVGVAAEQEVGVDGVVPLVLKVVGAELVEEADAAALLPEVYEGAGALLRDLPESEVELGGAVAAERAEDLAGEALGVD